MKITSPEACKGFLVDYLRTRDELWQVTILDQHPDLGGLRPLEKPLMVILEEKREVEPLAFQDYLGERLVHETNQIIEVRGRLLNITYQLGMWNELGENGAGEETLKAIQGSLEEIFAFDEYALKQRGISFRGFQAEKITGEPEQENLLYLPCQLRLQLLWEKNFNYEMVEEIIPHTELKEEE